MPESQPTVNELLQAVSNAMMRFTLATSSLPVDPRASDLHDAVTTFDDALSRLRRHLIISPDDPIEMSPIAENALPDALARLTELGIPERLPVSLTISLDPEVDGRGAEAFALQDLDGRKAVFVWDPIVRHGRVDVTDAARSVLDLIDPYGEDKGAMRG